MRFVYTALAFFCLLLNIAMIDALAHFTPIGLDRQTETHHELLKSKAEETEPPQSTSASTKTDRPHAADTVAKKVSMSRGLWILVSLTMILLVALPDIEILYPKLMARLQKWRTRSTAQPSPSTDVVAPVIAEVETTNSHCAAR